MVSALVACSTFVSLAEDIKVNYANTPFVKVLEDLESRTSYTFVYQKQLIEGIPSVTLKISTAKIEDIVEELLSGTKLEYEVIQSTIVLKERKNVPTAISARGTVVDEEGLPLPGVMVLVKGSTKGTSTDSEGRFSIDGVKEGQSLTFSCLGMFEQESKAKAKPMRVVMVSDAQLLADVVVIGYGTAKKSDLTGSVSNVKMSDISTTSSLSIDNSLQGRIAGADFLPTDGDPGSTTSIRIRGTRSISASNEPLIIVDGVMDAVSSLNDINPEDIAAISVLKDASSTAIYGSRGANGVIIITTKAGTSQKPTVLFKADFGVGMLPSKLDIMNGTEFALYRNDYAYFGTDSGHTSYGPEAPLAYAPFPDPTSIGNGTDWFDLVTRTAKIYNALLSLSGKTDKGTYYFSASYNNTEGIIRGSGQKKFTGRLKIDRQIYPWLNVGYNGSYTWRNKDENKVQIGGTNSWGGVMYLSPLIDPVENYNPFYVGGTKINTPTALIDQNTYYSIHNSTNHTVFAKVTPVKGLSINANFSYFMYDLSTFRYYPGSLPKKTTNEGGEAYRRELSKHNFSTELTAKYDFSIKKHSADVLLGLSSYASKSNDFSLAGSGYMDDEVLWNNMNAVLDKNTYSAATGYTSSTKMSTFARANYNYAERYFFTFTGRLDGASNFAQNKKWAFFPSGAFRWNISNESFMKGADKVDNLALRLSAGLTGNDAISAYRSLAALSTTTTGYIFGGTQPVATYTGRLAAPDLTWEKTASYNAAVDAEFFKNRLSITAEVYYSKTTDLLLTMQIPTHTGFSSRYGNVGSTSNKGVELTIDSKNISRRKFGWTTTFTLSHNSQKVLDIGTEDFVSILKSPSGYMMYGYVAGYPLNSLWGFKYGGVWHNDEEIERNETTHTFASSGNKTLGKAKYYDVNYDGVLNQDDLVYQGNADPYLYGGLQNTFNIGNLKIGLYFSYSLGGKIYNYAELYMAGSFYTNQYRYMLDSWHPVRNPNSDIPRAGAVDSNIPSDFMIHDASNIRFKTLSVAYRFDINAKWIKDITVSIVGDNLYLWKKYNGFDPDVSSEGTSSTLRRLDLGAYPKPRTITVGAQFKF